MLPLGPVPIAAGRIVEECVKQMLIIYILEAKLQYHSRVYVR